MVLTQKQTDLLHAAIELAFGTWDNDPGTHLNAIADRVASAAFGDNELVLFAWDPRHGYCYDCGAPAAYALVSAHGDESVLRCSTCAAGAAADGESITRLFREEERVTRWAVGIHDPARRLRTFDTEDEAVAWVGTLEGVLDGLYYVEPITETEG